MAMKARPAAKKTTTTKRLNRLGEVEYDLPKHLKDAMTQWGPPLLSSLAKEGCQVPTQAVRVGTDCSGLEAPLLSLRALGVPHRHVFSSEIDARKRKFIETNFAHDSVLGECCKALGGDGPLQAVTNCLRSRATALQVIA